MRVRGGRPGFTKFGQESLYQFFETGSLVRLWDAELLRDSGWPTLGMRPRKGIASHHKIMMNAAVSLTTQSVSSAVVDYPARDMTITVGAGMSLGELQKILHQENQQLPVDVADNSITIGQMVADDISGPRQFGYGTLRDYVIGIEAVDGTGRVFHAGGRVVKNVAGYDLCRLLVGSRGKLGTITQLTFKLKPLPVQQGLLVAGFRSLRDLESALERLNLTATTPVIMDVISRFAAARLIATAFPKLVQTDKFSDTAAILVLGFEGPAVSCQWQCGILKDELQGTAVWTDASGISNAAGHLDVFGVYCQTAQAASLATADVPWMAKISTLPSRVVSAINVMQEAGCEVFGRAGSGTLIVRPAANALQDGRVTDESQAFQHLQSLVEDGIGSIEVLKSSIARSTMSGPAVQSITNKLQELLGSKTTH
ncbi:MAG: FAD-binding oxidoreductase [Planctomycetota bacterium]|nr:MAG: FAD-binding oxidoreductase [Planctomycetota bacterium]